MKFALDSDEVQSSQTKRSLLLHIHSNKLSKWVSVCVKDLEFRPLQGLSFPPINHHFVRSINKPNTQSSLILKSMQNKQLSQLLSISGSLDSLLSAVAFILSIILIRWICVWVIEGRKQKGNVVLF